MLYNEFDPERRAIINPEDHHPVIPGFPPICIGIFSRPIVDWLLEKYGGEELCRSRFCTGDEIIWRVKAGDTEAALFVSHVGGPAAVSILEELVARGGKHFVFCGAAGVLDSEIAHGRLLVPTAAIRDEGASYHYLPAADEVELKPACVSACRDALNGLGFPFAEGKTWTTDAFYRETRTKLARRREQGCISVEMECASLAAAAQFRGVDFAQFFYATDTLDGEGWNSGILNKKGAGLEEVCFSAALETGKLLRERCS